MKNLVRLFVFTLAAGCVLTGCGQDGESGGSGGATSGSGGNGTGGNASGGSTGSGGHGSGGNGTGAASSSGGATGSGGSSSGGSSSGGSSSGGGSGSGGKGSGGVTASGGTTSTGGESATGGATSPGGAGGSGARGGAGGRTGSGGAAGATAMGGGNGGGTTGGGGASAAYAPCPTNGDACKILPLGDSITYGLITVQADKASSDTSINGKDSHGGYRTKLFADAVAAGQKLTFTGTIMNGPTMVSGMPFPPNNEGHSGYTIDASNGNGINVKALLDGAFKTLPQIILLHAGTNDVYASSGQAGMGDRLTALIQELEKRAPAALLVVSTIIPLKTTYAALATYNGQIPGIVSKEAAAGHHVVLVDMFAGFDANSLLSGDGIHPNQMGYDRMGDKFYAAISGVLPK